MRERLEIVLRISNVHCKLMTTFFREPWHRHSEMAPPHRKRALSVSWPISKHHAPLLAPYYESIFTPGSWSFIVPKFPSRLFSPPASPTPPSPVRRPGQWVVGRVQRLRLLRLASIVGSVGSKEELLRIISCSHSDPTRMHRNFFCDICSHNGATLFNSLKRLFKIGATSGKRL